VSTKRETWLFLARFFLLNNFANVIHLKFFQVLVLIFEDFIAEKDLKLLSTKRKA
jgi:hypothetical protein